MRTGNAPSRASIGSARPWGRRRVQRGFETVSTMPSSDIYLGERIRVRGITGPGALLLFVAFAILGLLLYYSQFSGAVRWLLALGIVSILSGLAWYQVSRRTTRLEPLVPAPGEGPSKEGELGSIAAAVRRADGGLLYSQVQVTSRARGAFLERARLSLGLSSEGMRDLQRDPAALRKAIRDEALAEFLHLRTQDLEEKYRWVLRARQGGSFATRFREILARMEAWR